MDHEQILKLYNYGVMRSMWQSLYHSGTAVIGGLLISMTYSLKWIVKYLVRYLEKLNTRMENRIEGIDEGRLMTIRIQSFLISVLRGFKCIIAIIDRGLRFLTDQAYVHTALLNHGFFKAAHSSFYLMIRRGSSVSAVVLISRVTAFTGVILTSCSVTAFIWSLVRIGMAPLMKGMGIYLIGTCFMCSWIISRSLFKVNTTVIDTILHDKLLREQVDEYIDTQQGEGDDLTYDI